jgi:hypothetical protein
LDRVETISAPRTVLPAVAARGRDGSGRIWHVAANGTPRQPELAAFYTNAGCTGAVYLQLYAVQGVAMSLRLATAVAAPTFAPPLRVQ